MGKVEDVIEGEDLEVKSIKISDNKIEIGFTHTVSGHSEGYFEVYTIKNMFKYSYGLFPPRAPQAFVVRGV
ncbi:MAG: hypothetical protein K8E24_005110 [Methanobacterium paludis]|nr:hypothetical protein [Methanobacterium paludis]